MELLLGVVLGIPASMVATYWYAKILSMRTKRRLSLEGVWGEYVPKSKGHQFSLGSIYFDRHRNLYAFDGTNFANDGSIFCHWTTTSSSVDLETRQFFYIFKAEMPSTPGEVYYGFGVVNLGLTNGVLAPVDAHYVSASVDKGVPMAHSMISLPDLLYSRGDNGREVIGRLSESRGETVTTRKQRR